MGADECYQLGYIVKTHGLNGEVLIQLDVDHPEEYEDMESVFLEQSGNLVPFFISHTSFQKNKVLVKFKDILNVTEAKTLVGSRLFLPLDELPELDEGQYYYHDLIGFEVFQQDQFIGRITSIYQPSSQFLAAIEIKGKEVLVPIEDDIFRVVDLHEQRVEVQLPDGLLDVYLNE